MKNRMVVNLLSTIAGLLLLLFFLPRLLNDFGLKRVNKINLPFLGEYSQEEKQKEIKVVDQINGINLHLTHFPPSQELVLFLDMDKKHIDKISDIKLYYELRKDGGLRILLKENRGDIYINDTLFKPFISVNSIEQAINHYLAYYKRQLLNAGVDDPEGDYKNFQTNLLNGEIVMYWRDIYDERREKSWDYRKYKEYSELLKNHKGIRDETKKGNVILSSIDLPVKE